MQEEEQRQLLHLQAAYRAVLLPRPELQGPALCHSVLSQHQAEGRGCDVLLIISSSFCRNF